MSPCGSEILTEGENVIRTELVTAAQTSALPIPAGATGEVDTAKLSQSGSGTVTFALYSTAQCAGSPVFTRNQPSTRLASITRGSGEPSAASDPVTQHLASGTYYWTAAYSDGRQP